MVLTVERDGSSALSSHRVADGNGANTERGKGDPGERRGPSAHVSLQHHYFSRCQSYCLQPIRVHVPVPL